MLVILCNNLYPTPTFLSVHFLAGTKLRPVWFDKLLQDALGFHYPQESRLLWSNYLLERVFQVILSIWHAHSLQKRKCPSSSEFHIASIVRKQRTVLRDSNAFHFCQTQSATDRCACQPRCVYVLFNVSIQGFFQHKCCSRFFNRSDVMSWMSLQFARAKNYFCKPPFTSAIVCTCEQYFQEDLPTQFWSAF